MNANWKLGVLQVNRYYANICYEAILINIISRSRLLRLLKLTNPAQARKRSSARNILKARLLRLGAAYVSIIMIAVY